MTYSETLEYLYNKLPMFSRIGSDAIKKDLTNTLLICEALGNPQNKFKSIHIAGTNGKGSVSHMLASVLQTAGYKTGLYTSPHLYDFRERIKVDGIMVSEGFVIDFTERVKPLIEKIQPSFFEITVAMAFEYFAQQKVDLAVVETGLGGRLDSTNIITPQLSVITNISYDHMNILGNTLEEIAGEKAGIIKQNIPVVIGERRTETEKVFIEKGTEKNAPLFFAEELFQINKAELQLHYLKLSLRNKGTNENIDLSVDLPGIYQVKNVNTLLAAIEILKQNNWRINKETIVDALQNIKKLTGLHGRWEVIQNEPTVVLEVAHNEDGIRQMLHHIELVDFDQLHIIFGVVKDKELGKVLELLPKNASYYFTQAHIPRALPGNQLQEEAKKIGLEGRVYENVNLALGNALKKAAHDDLIIVCGSIFLVAEVKSSSISMKL
jgi:dihydrofolate synthase / folylpolyglutamate synthase